MTSDNLLTQDEMETLVETGIVEEGDYEGSNTDSLPVYMDFRAVEGVPQLRSGLTDRLTGVIQEEASVEDIHAILGVPTGGNPPSALVADRLGLPGGYVRDREKEYGAENQFEGWTPPKARDLNSPYEGENVVLVDDVATSGGSLVDAVRSISAAGGEVKYAATYGFNDYGNERADEVLEDHDVDFLTLTRASDFQDLL